ncbi:hypothetical protein FPHYL_13374 [Fusarium phyllophilum]|uniref:Uncharacterized protein n=1 Tax=Fusarium phyllophilum TaxID=47803 RepID=A0A8H5MN55_9HYPO|nr:hypothetical protein FPHYL_13374 [Fusarium phyllophilum]
MPVSDDEVQALVAEVKNLRVEIDALNKESKTKSVEFDALKKEAGNKSVKIDALEKQSKHHRVEIDALKKIIGALIMEADLGGENVDQSTGIITYDDGNNGGVKFCVPKDYINLFIDDELSVAGFVEKGALLLRSKQPAFLLPEKFFDLFSMAAIEISESLNPSDDSASD